MAPKKQNKQPVQRCAADGCKVRMQGGTAAFTCAKCKRVFCSEHQYPSDHACQTAKPAASASDGFEGLVVVKSKQKKAAPAPAGSFAAVAAGALAAAPGAAASTSAVASTTDAGQGGLQVRAPKSGGAAGTPARMKSPKAAKAPLHETPHPALVAELVADARSSDLDKSSCALLAAMDALCVSAPSGGHPQEFLEREAQVLGIAEAVMAEVATRNEDAASLRAGFEKFLQANLKVLPRNAKTLPPRWGAVVVLYAMLVARMDPAFELQPLEHIVNWVFLFPDREAKLMGGTAVAKLLEWRKADRPSPLQDERCKKLMLDVWKRGGAVASAGAGAGSKRLGAADAGADVPDSTSAAVLLVGFLRGLGPTMLSAYGLLDLVVSATADDAQLRKFPARAQLAIEFLHVAAGQVGRQLEPYLIHAHLLEKCILSVCTKGAAHLRGGAEAAGVALLRQSLGSVGYRATIPTLERVLSDSSAHWRTRTAALTLLTHLAKEAPNTLFDFLPSLVPTVMEVLLDTKREVVQGANEALDAMALCISNPETKILLPYILDALKTPSKTEECLTKIVELTFVNPMDAQSLALIIPVVIRGLRERSADIKFKAVVTAGNVCSLVQNVRYLRPFVPRLEPELALTLEEHSNPEVRDAARRAKDSLLRGVLGSPSSPTSKGSPLGLPVPTVDGSSAVSLASPRAGGTPQYDRSLIARQVANVLGSKDMQPLDLDQAAPTRSVPATDSGNTELDDLSVDPITVEFCSIAVLSLLETLLDAPPAELTPPNVSNLVRDTLGTAVGNSHTEGRLSDLVFSHVSRIRGGSIGDANSARVDAVVDCDDIILAFAAKVLLRRTRLLLRRGERYGILGQNGVGKTTLLRRIAAKDINGFPQDVRVYFVEHEIGAISDSVLKFMLDAPALQPPTPEQARDCLLHVGFTDPAQHDDPVSSLSGGWRMRLAIARSMLVAADLLLLDEPTNHLHVKAVQWLEEYLRSLPATVVIVSHDYEFVDHVCTSLVRIEDQKLHYFDGSFSEFKEANPRIVAALPRTHNNVDREGGEDGAGGGENGGGASGDNLLDLLQSLDGPNAEAEMIKRGIAPMKFPDPGKLEGLSTLAKPVMTMEHVTFRYPGTETIILRDISCKLMFNARVVLSGANGAGAWILWHLLIDSRTNTDTTRVVVLPRTPALRSMSSVSLLSLTHIHTHTHTPQARVPS